MNTVYLPIKAGALVITLAIVAPAHPGNAAHSGVSPANPFSLAEGDLGAWEIAGRVSTVDLNDQLAIANGVGGGGRQSIRQD